MLLAPRTPSSASCRFWIDLSWRADVATVTAHGRLDADAAPELSARLSEIIEVARPRRLVVDLADVEYLDRAGATAILAAGTELPGPDAQLVIRLIPPSAVRFFRVTGAGTPPPRTP